YRALLAVSDTADGAANGKPVCTTSATSNTVNVYAALGATARISALCGLQFSYSSTVSGGKSPYTYAWQFQQNSLADGTGTWSTVGTSTSAGGTFTVPAPG